MFYCNIPNLGLNPILSSLLWQYLSTSVISYIWAYFFKLSIIYSVSLWYSYETIALENSCSRSCWGRQPCVELLNQSSKSTASTKHCQHWSLLVSGQNW